MNRPWIPWFLGAVLFLISGGADFVGHLFAEEPSGLRVATFDVDATPPVGAPMAYDPVLRHDEMTLRARGIVILGVDQPIVLCAVDWIGIANEGHDAFRDRLAHAAGTTRERVAVHTLHQHDAPGCDFLAEKLMRAAGLRDCARFEGTFARQLLDRLAETIPPALGRAQSVTHYGWGVADVHEVASNRRIPGPDGRVRAVRYTATKDPALQAEPEGLIDPQVSLLSLWNETEPVAVLSYYACHPQSYYRTGVPSPDFPGLARFIRSQDQPGPLYLHFNGAGGNVGAGKYNDGRPEKRLLLARRLADGMKRAWEATEKQPVTAKDVGWDCVPVQLPLADHLKEESLLKALSESDSWKAVGPAGKLAWLRRYQTGVSIDVTCLRIGQARLLHLPGELFVEYQLAAKELRPDLNVALAAYGDYGPGYIGTARAYLEGGYETSERASNVAPGVEEVLMGAIRQLLDEKK